MKFIGYIPGGYPTIDKSLENAEQYLTAGCNALEISIPPQDPSDEGPYIADLMSKAYRACSDYELYFEKLADFRKKHPDIEIMLLTFCATIKEIGLKKFVDFCRKLEVKYLISPDSKRFPDVVELLSKEGIYYSAAVHYDFTEEELNRCLHSKSFVYMQGFPSLGQQTREGYDTPDKIIKHLREIGVTCDIYCGVGVKTPEHVKILKQAGADGYFVGSGILAMELEGEALRERVSEFIREGI